MVENTNDYQELVSFATLILGLTIVGFMVKAFNLKDVLFEKYSN
ncbi:hypothetical protein [Brevibacillus laterosporus]|nr:hypothetical protein [Brevibacillus laterosporus]MCR8937527.1 hypothetical protein [Brevibacillus laterosporus]MCZ0840166.1 hypothetical protein [Brevibacillus laterosporus]MCZ0843962.1 hypothetical protein [Brevibacillus laterosporus]MED1909850.1 hypothetical protein [Brevibacillus laterosporus]WNX30823.1 hypothetical protein RWW94_21975 [Brevibacillus laterosporus]